MQIEVKLSIDNAEGFERAMHTLSSHHIKEECYYDFFFDFSFRALQERDSVLRLRVPCELQSGAEATAASVVSHTNCPISAAGDVKSGGGSNYDPEAEYEAFLRVCRGQGKDNSGVAAAQGGVDGETPLPLPPTSVASGAAGAAGAAWQRSLPRPTLIAGASGKLFLKQKNTVQEGHQMNFVAEDADVPADVVEALVRLVPESLFTTGMVSVPGQRASDTKATNAFSVLTEYAQRRPSSENSAISRIMAHLYNVARAYTPAERTGFVGKRARSGSQESDAHFTQVRFSSMGARTTYTQKQRATCALAEEEEDQQQQQQRKSGSSGIAVSQGLRLEVVGGFLTRRRIHHYIGIHQALGEDAPGSPREAELQEALRVRLDTSLLLPGLAIYELEVPKCGVAVEDVKEEVCLFLNKLGVHYHPASESKYARYVHYLAATRDEERDAMDVKLRLTNVNGYEEVRRNLQQLIKPCESGDTGALAGASAEAPRGSSEKRYMSNTEVDDEDGNDSDTWWQTNPDGYLQEKNEDFFFDSPEGTLRRGQTFLRLRKQHHLHKYILALKAHQVFRGGEQTSISSELNLSEVVAHELIDNPTQFLRDHCDKFPLMKTIWDEFEVRELLRTVNFTTDRLTVPWWAAKSQVSTLQRSWADVPANGTALPPQSTPIYTSRSFLLSQRQQRQEQKEHQKDAQPPPVAPLLIHLDKTLYEVPPKAKVTRVPFSQDRPWVDRQCATYEIEVTNIESCTEPKEVIRELTEWLNGIGVEWTIGVRSKLEQYFALIEA
jgi:adenylate cyclase class IV